MQAQSELSQSTTSTGTNSASTQLTNPKKRSAPSQSPSENPDYGGSPDSPENSANYSLPAPPPRNNAVPRSPTRSGNRSVPAFLNKLYNMVNDPQSNELIIWSEAGSSFLVKRPQDFAKEVLPRFFKHNNFSSFVRQLNMYGFHKIPHLQQGVLQSDGQSEQWEFSNSNFLRNQPDLLYFVTRKKGKDTENIKEPNEVDINHILNEIASIKKHQMTISVDLKNIQRDNQILWQETMTARDKHRRQQETIDKILRFLASVFSADKKRAIVPKKRRLLLGNSDTDYGNQGMIGAGNWSLGDEGQGVATSNPSASENDLNRLMNNPAALSILASLAVNDPSSANNLSQLDFLNSLPAASSDAVDDFLDPSHLTSLLQSQSEQILNQTAPSGDDPSSPTVPNKNALNSDSLAPSTATNSPVPTATTPISTSKPSEPMVDTNNAQYKVPEREVMNTTITPETSNLLNQSGSIFNTNDTITDIENRINAVDANVDYLTSLTAQLGYNPDSHGELDLEDGRHDFLSYYDANFNATEQDRQMLLNLIDSGKSANARENEETPKPLKPTTETTKTMTQYVPPMVQYPHYYQPREYTENQETFSEQDTKRLKTSVEGKDEDDRSTSTIDHELSIDDLLANIDDDSGFIGYEERK